MGAHRHAGAFKAGGAQRLPMQDVSMQPDGGARSPSLSPRHINQFGSQLRELLFFCSRSSASLMRSSALILAHMASTSSSYLADSRSA